MAWDNYNKNKKMTKKQKERLAKKGMKAVFGKNLFGVMILILLLCVAFFLLYQQSEPVRDFVDGLGIFTTTSSTKPAPFIDPNGDEMAIHYIDVGQGDATLLQTPAGNVLIDCGSKEYGDDVVEYLKSQGVESLEYVIFTHPHEDHMGCAAYVLSEIEVKNIIMNDRTSTKNYFEKALDVIEEKNINTILAVPGEIYTVGALQLRILGPYSEKFANEDTNNSSIIIHATYGHRAFLFTGDAEELGEEELLEHHKNELKCDIFSAGHHGSSTSNSLALLQAASPEYVVISVGEGNSYGHPHEEALNVFGKVGATVLRTDKLGSIVFVTDGETLTRK